MNRLRMVSVGCFAFALAGAGGAGWLLLDDGGSVPVEVEACRDGIRARLDKPDSVKWPGGESVEQDGSFVEVFGLVEAEDRYGARLEIRYKCTLQPLVDGGFNLLTID